MKIILRFDEEDKQWRVWVVDPDLNVEHHPIPRAPALWYCCIACGPYKQIVVAEAQRELFKCVLSLTNTLATNPA